jgi:hypothetical protein
MDTEDNAAPSGDQPREDDHATRPVSPAEHSAGSGSEPAGTSPREDNRNDEVEGSPVPDPLAEDSGADDVPEAD